MLSLYIYVHKTFAVLAFYVQTNIVDNIHFEHQPEKHSLQKK